jgi:uncharacterized membrane protein
MPGTLWQTPTERYNLRATIDKLRAIPLQPNVKVEATFPDSALYTPIVYIPQIIAIKVLSLWSAQPVYMVYLGRIFGLIAAVLLFAYAIRKMPFGKWALVAIGLLPMSVDTFASFSGDGMTIAYTALFVAMIARFIYDKKTIDSDFDSGVLLVATMCLALSKATYAILLLLLLALPFASKEARKRRNMLYVGGYLLLGICLAGLWNRATRYITTITSDQFIVPQQQFAYVKGHAWWVLHQPVADALLSTDANGMIVSLFGNFAWLTTPLPYLVIILEILVLVFAAGGTFAGELKTSLNLKPLKRITASAAILCMLAMSLALYAYWTPVGARVIDGLQGRYLLPVLIVLIPVMKTRRFVLKRETIAAWATFGSGASLIVTAIVLYARFYIRI